MLPKLASNSLCRSLELLADPPDSTFPRDGIGGMCLHTWLYASLGAERRALYMPGKHAAY